MTAFRKFVTAGAVAMAMLAWSVPVSSQVKGGEEECDYNLVINGWIMSGTTPIPLWSLEVTCVRIIDDEAS